MKPITIRRVCIFILAASSCAFAQQGRRVRISRNGGSGPITDAGPGPVTVGAGGAFGSDSSAPVQGAPYSATITNESVQTLADGNRIVQSGTGTVARDSQGRTRQDATLPAIGNLSAANAPHLVFIHDPEAQSSYTLNLTDKTAHKMPPMPLPPSGGPGLGGSNTFFIQTGEAATPPGPLPPPVIVTRKAFPKADKGQVNTEDLGSQTMEGVFVTGVRTTSTIPAGQIGNEKPITIVTEVWTSPDLKTIVYSKRSDPRMGEQTFQLTNISRAEPDPSLFSVPADFKIVEGPKPIIYRSTQ
ncbi:MAG: hypothetical protein DMG32_10360 [Acidobacteria bacterium]|nr:MAG: hypothetical protein DMG32_10360 [Acidobacteriota bacterium]